MITKKRFLVFVFLLAFGSLFLLGASTSFDGKNELKNYLLSRGISNNYIQSVFKDSRLTFKNVNFKGKEKYFEDDFSLFRPESVKRGKVFWQKHKARLAEAERVYGVKQEYLVSILRLESDFGLNEGSAPAINYLYTWAVKSSSDQAKRDFAKRELFYLFKIALKNNWDIFSIKGSYMGAIGYCQFLPENYERFAVDGDNNGIIDLFNWDDAIMSIANFLKSHGFEYSYEKIRDSLWRYNKGKYRWAVMLYAYLIQLPN